MPLFYFVTSRDNVPTEPAEAVEFPDADAAWEEATMVAGELLTDMHGELTPGTEWTIQVQDSSREPIRTLRVLAEAHKQAASVGDPKRGGNIG